MKSNEIFASMMAELLNKAVNPDISDITTEFTDKEGTITVSKEVYTLVNPKGKTETITVTDASIIEAIRSFKAAEQMGNMSNYLKAKALSRMGKHADILSTMGFKTVGKFAHHVLGISEVTANQYARIGAAFLDDNGLPLSCFPAGIEITKLLEFLPYCLNDDGSANTGLIEGLYARGVLVDGMRQNALREALKKNFKALPAASDKSSDNSSDKSSDKSSEKSSEKSSNKSSNKPNFIDNIDSMDSLQASAAILSALEVVRACIKKFANSDSIDIEGALQDCEQLANVARLIAK